MRRLQQPILFLGIWAGLIAASILLERLFNSGSQAGSGGMLPMPLFYLAALYLGWIPSFIVTLVVAIRRNRSHPGRE
jgi:hypothetical protein